MRRYTLSHVCVCIYTYIYGPCPQSSGTLRRTRRLKVSCVCEGHLRNPPGFMRLLATCDPQPSLEHVVVRPGVLVVEVQQRIVFEESRAPAAGVSLHTDGLSRSHGHTVTRSHSLLPHTHVHGHRLGLEIAGRVHGARPRQQIIGGERGSQTQQGAAPQRRGRGRQRGPKTPRVP